MYYVSRTGVTGARSDLTKTLIKETRRLRRKLDLPVAVGFGISTPEHVASVASVADGVVVGSALVDLIGEHGSNPDLPRLVESRVRELVTPLKG